MKENSECSLASSFRSMLCSSANSSAQIISFRQTILFSFVALIQGVTLTIIFQHASSVSNEDDEMARRKWMRLRLMRKVEKCDARVNTSPRSGSDEEKNFHDTNWRRREERGRRDD
jgi:hypothetical protein